MRTLPAILVLAFLVESAASAAPKKLPPPPPRRTVPSVPQVPAPRDSPSSPPSEEAPAPPTFTSLLTRDGKLTVKTNEEGASVTVDGNLVGFTPLIGSPLTGGRHTVNVEKDGFTGASQQINVNGDEVVVRVALEPSPEVRAAHKSKVNIMRGAGVGILVAGGLVSGFFMAATVTGALMWVASAQARAFNRFGQPFTDPLSAVLAPFFLTPVTLILGIVITLTAPFLALSTGAIASAAALAVFANAGDAGRYAAWHE